MRIYIDAVNDQRTVKKSLYSMRAQQCMSIPEPLEDWAGVSVDGTVQYGRASLDDGLRHVSFTLQHWRLCRDNRHLQQMTTPRETHLNEPVPQVYLWHGRRTAPGGNPRCFQRRTRMYRHRWSSRFQWSGSSCQPHLQRHLEPVKHYNTETDWLAVTTEVTSGLLPLWGLLLTVQEMTGDGVPRAWQDKARLWPLFKVTSPGSSLKAGLMLMDRRLSCLADPAALVATHVNTPASAGCGREPEAIQRLLVRLRAEKQ